MLIKSCSYSSDKVLSRCEMQFHYKYIEKLRKRLKKPGLFRGTIFHELMASMYLGQSWPKKFQEIQEKLWDKLFDEEKEMYGETFMEEIYALMQHYEEYWANDHKKWKVIAVEKKLSLATKYGFPVRWVCDVLARVDGALTLVETKAKERIPESDERILAPQVHAYCWLLSKKKVKVDRILWNYVRTLPVPEPQINKDGSLSKRKINTDRRTYLKALKKAGLDKHPEYQAVARSLPETLSLERVVNSPNLEIGEQFVRDWVERHRRAQGVRRPLRTFNWLCKNSCDFFQLCQVDLVGKTDRSLIIKKDFIVSEKVDDLEEKVSLTR